MSDRVQIAIPLFPRFTALDGIGPYEVLQRVPNFDVTFVAAAREDDDVGCRDLLEGRVGDEAEHPVLAAHLAAGGVGTRPLERDDRVLAWLRAAHATTRYTTSVCTGSIVLGAAGLLVGLTATTHWSCYRELAEHGAEPTAQRVVEHLDHRIITAAGVSSGIDMALRLVELLADRTAAQAAQLMIEYDPEPPFDCGSVAKADDTVMTRVIEYAALRQ